MRPKSPWNHAYVKLKRLYDQRVPEGMTQAEFGRLYDIGNQSMVAQYLNGTRPLNYDVAAKFARALKCKIEDFCPEMANTLSLEIFPYLGKALRRVALLVLAIQLGGIPSDANADQRGFLHNTKTYYTFWAKCLLLLVKLFKTEHIHVVGFLQFARTLHVWERYHSPCRVHP